MHPYYSIGRSAPPSRRMVGDPAHTPFGASLAEDGARMATCACMTRIRGAPPLTTANNTPPAKNNPRDRTVKTPQHNTTPTQKNHPQLTVRPKNTQVPNQHGKNQQTTPHTQPPAQQSPSTPNHHEPKPPPHDPDKTNPTPPTPTPAATVASGQLSRMPQAATTCLA